ncbi:hypothetical protein IFM89_016169 [Coptis chinensis]|uniref:F-box domain-containing protein n=1 Tax=Coptis chinensis TaxID=261450 RepID=A0A835GWQ0_9MAGN|nr:hypothetical protein IFM89_016169 [Coptis chinensis]
MDFTITNPQVSSTKKLKSENEMGMSIPDRISRLPDETLHKILALLDMKCAVKTSILSTRWRYLWTYISTLNFNSNVFLESTKRLAKDTTQFKEFVDQVFIHNKANSILKFYILYDEKRCLEPPRVYSWIRALLHRNIQELDIDISTDASPFHLPVGLFTCPSLTVLKLKFGYVRVPLQLPCSVSLPSLKTMHLKSVCFVDESRTSKLFRNCPVLESLIIMDSGVVMLANLFIYGHKLKDLVIENCCDEVGGDEPAYCKIQICAPNIESFRCKDHMSRVYSIENCSSIVSAGMDMEIEKRFQFDSESGMELELPGKKTKEYAVHVIKSLRAICNVRELALSPSLIEVVSKQPAILERISVQFLHLRCLMLKTWLSRDCIRAVFYMLKISPLLDTLIIEVTKKADNSTSIGEYQDTLSPLQCMSQLKFVQIEGVLGCTNELKFLEILLQNALVLETLVVLTCEEQLPDKAQRSWTFFDRLQQFPRASSNIAIFFH